MWALTLCCLVQALASESAPPGMVLVPGGRTKIGSTVKDIDRLLSIDPNSQNYAGALSAETPQHEQLVESFYYGLTEVTNEQYAAFVRSTKAKPPFEWAQAAVATAAQEFLAGQEAARAQASEEGLPLPEPASFHPRAWWDEHWRGMSWSIPQGDALRPVVYVDLEMARAYLDWAGLRLPLETEYQRAVRGDSDRRYPWGDQWDDERFAATLLLKRKGGPYPVGSFPAGASRQGLLDLAGNVWEWTASRYTEYPGYQSRVLTFGYANKARQVNALAAFDADQFVVVGGSFQNGNLVCRASTRRNAAAQIATESLGFRAARSLRGGVDRAQRVLETELTPIWRPDDGADAQFYAPQLASAYERWTSASEVPAGAPAGYACIESHVALVFCPVSAIAATDWTTFERLGETHLGFLHTTVDLIDPPLERGTYLLSYRERQLHIVQVQGKRKLTRPIELEWGNARASSWRALDATEPSLLELDAQIATRTTGKNLGFRWPLRMQP